MHADDFGPAPRDAPDAYPGRRCSESFLLWGTQVLPMGPEDMDRLLLSMELPPLSRRTWVLAYGSNACPAQLVHKGFSALPVLRATVRGVAAVYAGFVSKWGYIPAGIAGMDVEEEAWLTLLDAEQMAVMDSTEDRGILYHLAEIRSCTLQLEDGTRVVPVLAYVPETLYIREGRPIRMDEVPQSDIRSMTDLEVARTSEYLDYRIVDEP